MDPLGKEDVAFGMGSVTGKQISHTQGNHRMQNILKRYKALFPDGGADQVGRSEVAEDAYDEMVAQGLTAVKPESETSKEWVKMHRVEAIQQLRKKLRSQNTNAKRPKTSLRNEQKKEPKALQIDYATKTSAGDLTCGVEITQNRSRESSSPREASPTSSPPASATVRTRMETDKNSNDAMGEEGVSAVAAAPAVVTPIEEARESNEAMNILNTLVYDVTELQSLLDNAIGRNSTDTPRVATGIGTGNNASGSDTKSKSMRPYQGPFLDVPADFTHENFQKDKDLVKFTEGLFGLACKIAKHPTVQKHIWNRAESERDKSAIIVDGGRVEVFVNPDDEAHGFCKLYKDVFEKRLGVSSNEFTKFVEQVTTIQNAAKFDGADMELGIERSSRKRKKFRRNNPRKKKVIGLVSFIINYDNMPQTKNLPNADAPQVTHADNDGSGGSMFGTMTCSKSAGTECCDISHDVPPSGQVGTEGVRNFLKKQRLFGGKGHHIDSVMDKNRDHSVNSQLCDGFGHLVLADPSTIQHNEEGKLSDPCQVKLFLGSHPHRDPATSDCSFDMILFFTLHDSDFEYKAKTKDTIKNVNEYDGFGQFSREKLIWFLHRNLLLKHNYEGKDTTPTYTDDECKVMMAAFFQFFKDSAWMGARDTTIEIPFPRGQAMADVIYDIASQGGKMQRRIEKTINALSSDEGLDVLFNKARHRKPIVGDDRNKITTYKGRIEAAKFDIATLKKTVEKLDSQIHCCVIGFVGLSFSEMVIEETRGKNKSC